MQITVLDLEREPLEFDLALPPGAIQYGEEVAQTGDLAVKGRADVIEEHRGPRDIVSDIRLRASYKGKVEIGCARCLEPVPHAVSGEFDLIFRPIDAEKDGGEHAISASETEIGYYQGGGLSLEDVLREQVLLSLPVRTLCREDCKGLCPHCGRDLNSESCTCEAALSDPRWSALSDLRSRIKS
ncbi:YceD family protein [Silvibacterium sp.]|uniref:YceD family protein n=1 Tax=Silvibacterium sp. TaxID=1964179 RepID=UPI0039E41A0D